MTDKESKTQLLDLSSGLGEAALDSLLKDGLFKDIPVIGSLISIGRLTRSVTDALLLTRILCFVNELHLKSQEQIDEFKGKYFQDENYKEIGSKLLFALERADDARKIKWQAKLIRLMIDRKIDRAKFLRLVSIINNCFAGDAEQITVFQRLKRITSNNESIQSYVLDHLFSIGFLDSAGIDGGDMSGKNSGTVYELNEFGETFLNDILIENCP
jgi:hypothetical protein